MVQIVVLLYTKIEIDSKVVLLQLCCLVRRSAEESAWKVCATEVCKSVGALFYFVGSIILSKVVIKNCIFVSLYSKITEQDPNVHSALYAF